MLCSHVLEAYLNLREAQQCYYRILYSFFTNLELHGNLVRVVVGKYAILFSKLLE